MLLKYDVEATPELRNFSFAIRKLGAPSHHLAADSEEMMHNWITVIKEAVERNNQVKSRSSDYQILGKIKNLIESSQ